MSAAWSDAQALSYIASYADLIRAFGANPVAGRAHYAASGQAEGRSISFDAARYAASYRDLTQAFGTNADAAARHYIVNGFSEGRSATFDALRYTASYGDLIGAFGTDTAAATQHYLANGFREGRSATFDALRYTASYGDLIGAFGMDAAAATRHFIVNGYAEGRSASFDALRYTASYGDLIGAFGLDGAAATRHYIVDGYREGRGIDFDPLRYVASYRDLIDAFGVNTNAATRHFIVAGAAEGRTATFDAVAYLLDNADLGRAGLNAAGALRHWVTDGAREGRTGDAAYGREQTSNALAVGQTVTGVIDSATDKDWFALNLVAGQGVKLTFAGADPGPYDAINVFAANGRDSQLFRASFAGDNNSTGFVAPVTGTYYVSLRPWFAYVGNYTLAAAAFATMQGADRDFFAGTDGNDVLTASAGGDWLFGRKGDDTYVINDQTAVVIERPGEGTDEIRTNNSFSFLPNNVENLTLTGTGATSGGGNNGDNFILGNSGSNFLNGRGGNDILVGGAGVDQLVGGTGDDTYVFDGEDDIFENPGEGTDLVLSGLNFTLPGNVENLTLSGTANINGTGNAENNVITGNIGNNILDGLTGTDTLIGRAGDDLYLIDGIEDTIIELTGEGADLVYIPNSYTLPDNIEYLVLAGTGNFTGTGNGLDNRIFGNDANNVLTGFGGNDFLNGGENADAMIGGMGDDAYVVDNSGDIVVELSGEGTDTVFTSITYVLSDNFENLTLIGSDAINGTGNALNNIIMGNNFDNVLSGSFGNDTIMGAGGIDTMLGGPGDDIYSVEDIGDQVVEYPDVGTDQVNAFIDYTLPANVENLSLRGNAITGNGNSLGNLIYGNGGDNVLFGGDGDDSIFGDALFLIIDGVELIDFSSVSGDDFIDGGNGADNLYGGRGDDLMRGGAGADVFYHGPGRDAMTGGTGADRFVFQSIDDFGGATIVLADSITDFNQSEGDKIELQLIDANTTVPGKQGFQWLGLDSTAPTTGGQGALWYTVGFAGTLIYGDYTADGVADFMIQLNGFRTLQAADFILG